MVDFKVIFDDGSEAHYSGTCPIRTGPATEREPYLFTELKAPEGEFAQCIDNDYSLYVDIAPRDAGRIVGYVQVGTVRWDFDRDPGLHEIGAADAEECLAGSYGAIVYVVQIADWT